MDGLDWLMKGGPFYQGVPALVILLFPWRNLDRSFPSKGLRFFCKFSLSQKSSEMSANGDESQLQTDEKRELENGAESEATEKEDHEIRSNDAASADEINRSELLNGEGSRSFTMRELLNELKDDRSIDGNGTPERDGMRASTAASADGERRDTNSFHRSIS